MWFLALLFSLEMGYAPFYGSLNSISSESIKIENTNVYYITLDTEAILYDNFFIGGAIKTYMQDMNDDYTYYPFESDYIFKMGLRYDNIEIGFRHFCLHPVRPFDMYYEPQGDTDASYEEFYIKISGGF